MKGGVLNGLRGKRLSLFLIIIGTLALILRWERTPIIVTFLPPRETFSVFPPAFPLERSPAGRLRNESQHSSGEEDFSDVEVLGSSSTEEAKEVLDVLPPKEYKSTIKLSFENKGCNYGKGKWVADDRRPLYSGFGCKQWLSDAWACRLMQRTDFSYEKFRWQPESCEMPEFEGSGFLQRMKDKTIAFVGDSLGRQQFQSLMCMVTGGKEIPEVEDIGAEYGFILAPGSKRPDGWAYRFPATNTTILYHWSATLCQLEPLNASDPSTIYAMHLDRPASFLTRFLHKLDVLVLNTGHHWNRGKLMANRWEMYVRGAPNTDRKTALIWNAKNLTTYSVVRWVDSQFSRYPRLRVFLTTLSPRHFANGDWNSGGSCDNTRPLAGGSVVSQDGSSDPISEGAVKGTGVELLDITALSQLRDEGHISRYGIKTTQGAHDCLHWCLPGVPDAWNEILYARL